jgi:thiol:disulfide interchange protein DsbD
LHGERRSAHRVLLRWRIAPGYYLYRDKIRVRVVSPAKARIAYRLPAGIPRKEPEGVVPVYYHDLLLTVRLRHADGRPVVLDVYDQGCAVRGLCYPPEMRTLTLAALRARAAAPSPSGVPPPSAPTRATPGRSHPGVSSGKALSPRRTSQPSWTGEILLFFLAGILLAFTPCGAPMVPILLTTLGRAGGGTRGGRVRASVVYVLAVAITYGLLGLLAAAAGRSLIPFFENPWVVGIFAALFAFYGTAMLAEFRLELPERWRNALARLGGRERGTVLTPLLLGVGSALLASPCLTPAVAAGLTLAVYQGEVIRGSLLLFVLGLGLGIPLLAAALAAGAFWPRGGPWLTAVERLLGFALYGLALWFAARVLPGPVVVFLFGVLLALMAAFVHPGASASEETSATRFRRGFTLILAVLAFGEILGSLGGSGHLLTPLRFPVTTTGPAVTGARTRFHPRVVRSPAGLARAFAQARRERRPLLLDYDARWCVSCAIMDRTVFTRRRVVAALRPFLFVRANVTRDDRASARLLARYRVLGPPTFLYFAFRHGRLATRPTARLVGAQSTRGFLAWLRRLPLQAPSPGSAPTAS